MRLEYLCAGGVANLVSRLHLVNQNERLHRWLLIMIIVGSTLIIIPNWVFIFPAYDIDPAISSVWSPACDY